MPRPNLAQFRKSARDLLTAVRADDPLARKRVAGHIPRFARSATDLRLAEAQFVVARENGYSSWSKLKAAVAAGAAGDVAGPGGHATGWHRALVHDAARQAAESAADGDVTELLRAFSLLPKRHMLRIRELLVESSDYSRVVETLILGLELPQPRLRFECAHLMDHFADERCVPPLQRLLDDPIPRIRRVALHSLSCDRCKLTPLEQETDFVGLAIEQALHDPSIQVRRHAVAELSVRGHDPRVRVALEHIQTVETDGAIRKTCARILDHR